MSSEAEAKLPSINRRRLEVFEVFHKIGALGFGVAAIRGLMLDRVRDRADPRATHASRCAGPIHDFA
jgi:hypothetical protein